MTRSMRILLILLVACIGYKAFANSGYEYIQNWYSEDPIKYASRSIYLCSDNSVVVLGNYDCYAEFNFHDFVITKLDPQGNLLWRHYPGNGSLGSITGVDIDVSDTVTFITSVNDEIRFWEIDSAGEASYFSYYEHDQTVSFNKSLRTPLGQIIAVGKTFAYYTSSACFFRFSSAGDTLATVIWPVDTGSPSQEAEAYDLLLLDNGNVLVTCSLHSSTGSVLEVSPDGNILSRIDIPGDFSGAFSNLTINRSLNDESYILAGRTGSYPDSSVKIFLLSAGEITYLFEIDPGILQDICSVKLHTDSIYLCGRQGGNGKLINVSYTGEINWIWEQSGDNLSRYQGEGLGSESTALLDLDSLGCIYWAWGDDEDQVIIKLLPNGQLPVDDDLAIPAPNRISAYPNPMKDQLSIKLTQDDGAAVGENRIDIYNIKGQLVRSVQLGKGETQWDGKDKQGQNCPCGIYLLRSTNHSIHTTKICKSY